jgi:hypothetical protein
VTATAAAAASGGGCCIRWRRLHPPAAVGEGEGGREQQGEGRESREGEEQGAAWWRLPV